MKSITHTFIATAAAVYITSLWNPGFQIQNDLWTIAQISIVLTIVFLVINPLLNLVLLPINLFTFGIVGTLINLAVFYFIFSQILGIEILSATIAGIQLPALVNLAVIVVSISFFVSLVKTLL